MRQQEQARAMEGMAAALQAKFSDLEGELLETQTLLHASCDGWLANESPPCYTPASTAFKVVASPTRGLQEGSPHGWMVHPDMGNYQASESILILEEGNLLARTGDASTSMTASQLQGAADHRHQMRGLAEKHEVDAHDVGLNRGLSPTQSTHANPQA